MSGFEAVVSWSRDGGAPRRVRFDAAFSVGRGLGSRILLDHPSASREHLRLEPTIGGVLVRNVSRQGGATLDGEAIPPGAVRVATRGQNIEVHGVVIEIVDVPESGLTPQVRCANDTCARVVDATASDCPWCGHSLAFAHTAAPRRG